MNKKLLFSFSLLSVFGFFAALATADGYYFDLVQFLIVWLGFSVPLIIQLIYGLIFRK